ncbi:tRNA pseudouridine synthase D [Shewanella sp. NFH-SH190041]|uniref:tRNA pseudouridine(13) synthase TruD n=1 Tax=Shewanella sp. NFH-SH190041 TaxID=2950245 RepID=UPI0021C43389|nr:tRNA pseudouridine(13) synthase TruD [Shewanella sp. NFH-SH190041]BDM65402.1 tRNA pseudouridine synthase D [Shewanella sp. NFH-SH190041]
MNELTYRFGRPAVKADLRTENADFQVQEILPFVPCGEGEHHLVHIRKSGLNTVQVAKMLADFAKVHPKEVTFAGQKDKNAITEQWFGIRIPGKITPLWHELNSDDLTVLSSTRHNKKLRIGALAGNRFALTLRQVSDMEALLSRVASVAAGVPNYFGEQRFGHDGRNLDNGRKMLAGRKVKDRNKRSMYLSAVRSNIFNQVVSRRLAIHGVLPLAGDCVMLTGSRSFFVAEQWDDTLSQRLADRDIQLSAPLWGRGQLPATGDAGDFELQQIAAAGLQSDCDGLENAGLEQERRTLLLRPEGLKSTVIDNRTLLLEFMLPSGCFATSVLRELCQYDDVQERLYRERLAAEKAQQEIE